MAKGGWGGLCRCDQSKGPGVVKRVLDPGGPSLVPEVLKSGAVTMEEGGRPALLLVLKMEEDTRS